MSLSAQVRGLLRDLWGAWSWSPDEVLGHQRRPWWRPRRVRLRAKVKWVGSGGWGIETTRHGGRKR